MDATLQRIQMYNSWATESLLSHLANQTDVPPACIKLIQHIVNAESIWISRILSEKPKVGVWEEHSLPECRLIHRESSVDLDKIINSDMDLNKEISYVNTQGDSYLNSIHDILIHVLNHATYHRAQVAKELRCKGLEPINTDYISYVRTALV